MSAGIMNGPVQRRGGGYRQHQLALMTILVVASMVVAPGLAEACAVCYGAVDSPLTEGVNKGILVLLAVIAAVQVGFVTLFLSIRQRARQVRQQKERLQVMQGGAG